MLSTFSSVSGPSVCLPWKSVCSILCPFFNWVFVFLEWNRVTSLYILEIRPLSEVSLANISSHMVGSLFTLLMFSLAVQKLFILMKSHLFTLSFMTLALSVTYQWKYCCMEYLTFSSVSSPLELLWYCNLYLSLLSILSLLLCMAKVGDLVSFFLT